MRNFFMKIYVEVERARLSHRLAKIKEAEGDVSGAAAVMLELQVFVVYNNNRHTTLIKVYYYTNL